MSNSPEERSCVLVVRVWIEGEPRSGLRARITRSADNHSPERSVATAASVGDICSAIRASLNSFVAEAETAVTPP